MNETDWDELDSGELERLSDALERESRRYPTALEV